MGTQNSRPKKGGGTQSAGPQENIMLSFESGFFVFKRNDQTERIMVYGLFLYFTCNFRSGDYYAAAADDSICRSSYFE